MKTKKRTFAISTMMAWGLFVSPLQQKLNKVEALLEEVRSNLRQHLRAYDLAEPLVEHFDEVFLTAWLGLEQVMTSSSVVFNEKVREKLLVTAPEALATTVDTYYRVLSKTLGEYLPKPLPKLTKAQDLVSATIRAKISMESMESLSKEMLNRVML